MKETPARLAYSVEEAAFRTGVGRTLIYAEIKAGHLTARKAGLRTIITTKELNAWLNALPKRAEVDAHFGGTYHTSEGTREAAKSRRTRRKIPRLTSES